MILFLDFDGVLHPEVMGTEELCHLPALEELLREFPHVEVVLSTSWRVVYPHEELLALFSPDIRRRIIGATPQHEDIPLAIRERLSAFVRQAEIEAWLQMNQAQEEFIVIDDCPSEFSPNWAPLFLVDKGTGITQPHLRRLRDILRNL